MSRPWPWFIGSAATVFCGLVGLTCRALKLKREDAIAAYFCSVKKTLAMGVPLAMLIFGARSDLSLILLPIMFYHPLQLLVNSLLANRWARQAARGAGGERGGDPGMDSSSSSSSSSHPWKIEDEDENDDEDDVIPAVSGQTLLTTAISRR